MSEEITIPFIGGAYEQRSSAINAQRSVNWFPVIDDKQPRNVLSMYGTPGLKLYKLLSGFGPPSEVDVVITGAFVDYAASGTITASGNDGTGLEETKTIDGSDTTRWATSNKTYVEYASKTNFPARVAEHSDVVPDGAVDTVYVALDTGNTYVWSATAKFYARRTVGNLSDNEYTGNYISDSPTYSLDGEQYWECDLGEGNTEIVNRVRLQMYVDTVGQSVKGFTLLASNDSTTWRTICTRVASITTDKSWLEFSTPNVIAYRYYKLIFTSTWRRVSDELVSLYEVQLGYTDAVRSKDLQCDNLTVNAGVTLDTCGYAISVSNTLINNGTITDTVSGGNGGDGGAGGVQPSISATGNNGVAGSAGNDSAKEDGGAGGAGGSGGGGGGDVSTNTYGFNHVVVSPGGNGGKGGTGGRGGGYILIFAKTLTNNGTIHANGFDGEPGYAGRYGELVATSQWYLAGGSGALGVSWQSGGGAGGGQGGQGGAGGSVFLFYVNRTVGTVTANDGTSGAGGSKGIGATSPAGTPYVVVARGTMGEGGTGAEGAGNGGKAYSPYAYASESGKADDGTDGETGDTGESGVAEWSLLTYPAVLDSNELRCFIKAGVNLYVVMGSYVFKITPAGVTTNIGAIYSSSGNVFMAYNGSQILITDETRFGCYVDADDVVHLITDPDFPVAMSCAFMDGYFVVTSTAISDEGREIPGRINVSGLYDASSWGALDYATAEGHPDKALCVHSINNNLWIHGDDSTEVHYNTGNADQPFSRIDGALIDDGTAAVMSVTLVNDQFYWLSNKREIVRNVGYQRDKISTTHIDIIIQAMTVVSDARGFTYRIDGHIFYALTFPTEDITLVYDITTGYWHEWSSYKTQGVATYGRHRTSCTVLFNGVWLAGDYTNGKIYQIDMASYTEDGEFIYRQRRAQYIAKGNKRVFHHEIELVFETGVGLAVGSPYGTNPVVALSWSDDYGNTWSTPRERSLGVDGDYNLRVMWKRLGQSRNRIYQLSTSEAVKLALVGCEASLEVGR
jgi:hypothetical protein